MRISRKAFGNFEELHTTLTRGSGWGVDSNNPSLEILGIVGTTDPTEMLLID